MKIAVIAANGRSGQAFVKAAIAQGHIIHAGIMGPDTLPEMPGLTKVNCDATNVDDVRTLLKDQEAVVSLIGHVRHSPSRVQTAAMQQIVATMKDLGIKRIISLTGTGVRFPGDKVPFIDRLLNLGISLIDPARIQDGKDHVRVLQHSGLDWTVIRVLKLQDLAPQPFVLREHGPTKLYVSRQDVAKAILEVLDERSFVRQAPIICR